MILKDFYEHCSSHQEGSLYISSLKINKEHPLYNGHFPGRPVTPGVVLMQLFKEEAQRITGEKLRLVRAENVKFISVFDPTDENELVLESELENTGEFIKLKGMARSKSGTVLKITSLYQKL